MSVSRMLGRCLSVTLLLLLAGCSVNPVTGQRQLSLVDEGWELNIGREQYAPIRQSQGGDFVLDPELVAYVQEVGQRVAAEADRELPYEFKVLNSSVPNAWALPGGKLAINRGLLTELRSEAELAAVLGHEVTHSAARHGASRQSQAVLLQGAVLAGGIATRVATGRDDYATVALLGGMVGAQLITQRYSREAEREADYYGMMYMHRAGYNPRGAVELQETFVRLSEGRDSAGFAAGLFASHPPSQERVRNNRRTLEELGDEGIMGEERYQRAVARLMALQPAYEAHDSGRKALAEGDAETALARADEALALEQGEALFHNLRGDALLSKSDYAAAESAFSEALRRDEGWFYQHLQRGVARYQQGKHDAARTDLQASLQRLPTAPGHYYLGNVERASGNRDRAIQHYRQVAQQDSAIGERARRALRDLGAAP